MLRVRYEFASDNTAGAAPEAMAAIIRANAGFTAGYGADDCTRRAGDMLRGVFDTDAEVHFVGTGTAANAIALSTICEPFESVLVHTAAHVLNEETGAAAHFGHGLCVVPLKGENGKVRPISVTREASRPETAHDQLAGALSLTNPTEYGTVYSQDELTNLAIAAKARDLAIHLDGSRLANAIAAGLDPSIIVKLGIDVVVVGGTKAGMTPTEAIMLLNPTLSRRFGARLKQSGQLPSKGRYLASPWIGMLEAGAWIKHASHANEMAAKLAGAMPFPLTHPVQTNGVFVRMDKARRYRLRGLGWMAFQVPDGSVRFMCSWATTDAMIEELIGALRSMA
jgi:threonine aldolase